MRAAAVLGVVLCCLVALASAQETAETKPFSFYEFFQGEWGFQKKVVLLDSDETVETIAGLYSIKPVNDSATTLVGTYTENRPDSISEPAITLLLKLDFETPFTGSMQQREDEDSGFIPMLNFDFSPKVGDISVSAGRLLSESAVYQFSALNPQSFTITIFREDAQGHKSVVSLFARKVVLQESQSFFAKYGSPIMLFCMLVVPRLISAFKGPAAAAGGQRRARDPAAGGAEAPAVEDAAEEEEEEELDEERKKDE
eukprot:gnl/Hemi2/20152_TR6678_c0_g1_i1.p1 gnl/Hemi2/20152_TR6678_c0_g1~~gnl/Hemi2/20152_TR6678_c0_g1_i1.p1  ORF type:complete len:270 (+),score=90.04 gnl/Hemi2/20152_TR6678_c0_g1_i1:43-810(+)